MALVRFIKDPDAVLEYTLDWSDWLVDGDFIVSVEFLTPPPLELTSETFFVKELAWAPELGLRQLTQVWIKAGSGGSAYDVTCHVKADSGREDDRTFQIVCRNK